MPVDLSFEGRSYPPSEPYVVGREAVRAFATAVGASSPLHHDPMAARAAGYADVVAPPTFAVVIAQRCEAQYVADPAAGIDFAQVVHAEERFASERPIVAGEEIVATLTVQRVREVAGNVMVTTQVEMREGAPAVGPDPDTAPLVGHVTSMLVVRGEGK
ncbi:MAG: MaoC family dehydratase N-terminal domain-containing protein [Austwickia sp.]|jgi:acyl dehydratase|nr:MAG: MaoC family dehydratase N-terminal domain-containing protein [Austwickia sp.]